MELQKILEFTKMLAGLKKIERFRGQVFWKDYPFPDRYESVADHTWRMTMLLVVSEKYLAQPVDLRKALIMSLIHDIPEIIAGDASVLGTDGTGKDSHAYNTDAKDAKYQAELKAAKEIFGTLPKREADELYNLWIEFEEQKTFEAKVVKALDKIEGRLQAVEYSNGVMYKTHVDFSLVYGVETGQIDPALNELGLLIVEELRSLYTEFTPDEESKETKQS